MSPDWAAWHERYDRPGSRLSARLLVVQGHIRDALDDAPPGPVAVVSMCAGEGRDLLGLAVFRFLEEPDPAGQAKPARSATAR